MQQEALKKKERIKELSDNETEDTNRYNTIIQENKSYEKQISIVQDSVLIIYYLILYLDS